MSDLTGSEFPKLSRFGTSQRTSLQNLKTTKNENFAIVRYNESHPHAFTYTHTQLDDINVQACGCDSFIPYYHKIFIFAVLE